MEPYWQSPWFPINAPVGRHPGQKPCLCAQVLAFAGAASRRHGLRQAWFSVAGGKEDSTVRKRFFLFLLALITFPCLTGSEAYTQAKESSPIVHFSYAQEKIRQGEIWKIYLSASDPDGGMSSMVCNIEQPGADRLYKPSIIYLKKGMQKRFVGYFALHTSSAQNLSGEELILNLSILDRSGNVRKALSFPLEFDGEPMRPLLTDSEKELNQRIGIIDVDFDLSD
jgi:hypothetical protein